MIIKDVVVLREAADDLEAGLVFYDQREAGVGDYFWDSLIADVESLSFFPPPQDISQIFRYLSLYKIHLEISQLTTYPY